MKNQSSARFLLAPLALMSVGLVACSSSDDPAPLEPTTISSTLSRLGLTTLATAVAAADLDDDLATPGPFTLFAPTNAAFEALDPATLTFLLDPANQAALIDVLNYHVVAGELDSTAVATSGGLTSAQTGALLVDAVGTDLYINNARVVTADNGATNGVIHVIDTVLRIPDQSLSASLTTEGYATLVDLVGRAGLTATLDGNPFTVLAPSDAAFAALQPPVDLAFLQNPANVATLQQILTNHLIPGANLTASTLVGAGDAASQGGQRLFVGFTPGSAPTVNGTVNIDDFNRPATGGLIHGLDAVIADPGDAIQVATDAGVFTSLVQEVDDAGLTATLQGAGPFTIFAPTDTAFTNFLAANPGTTLFDPGQEAALAQLLQYHVLGDAIQADELSGLATVTTLETSDITIGDDGMGTLVLSTDPGNPGNVTSSVTGANVFANNAVIHVIDTVLVPPGFVIP